MLDIRLTLHPWTLRLKLLLLSTYQEATETDHHRREKTHKFTQLNWRHLVTSDLRQYDTSFFLEDEVTVFHRWFILVVKHHQMTDIQRNITPRHTFPLPEKRLDLFRVLYRNPLQFFFHLFPVRDTGLQYRRNSGISKRQIKLFLVSHRDQHHERTSCERSYVSFALTFSSITNSNCVLCLIRRSYSCQDNESVVAWLGWASKQLPTVFVLDEWQSDWKIDPVCPTPSLAHGTDTSAHLMREQEG